MGKDPETAEDLSGASAGLFYIFCTPFFLLFLFKKREKTIEMYIWQHWSRDENVWFWQLNRKSAQPLNKQRHTNLLLIQKCMQQVNYVEDRSHAEGFRG